MTAVRVGRARRAAEARPVVIAAGRVRIARLEIVRAGRVPVVIVRRATGGGGIAAPEAPADVRRSAGMNHARSGRPRRRS